MLEQKIRSELDRTTGPAGGGGGDVDGVMRRGRFLRRRLALARGGAAVLVAVAAVGVGSLLDRAVPEQPDPVADGVVEPDSINVPSGLDIPIDGRIESVGQSVVYRGRLAPAPRFEPAGFEFPLVADRPLDEPPAELLGPTAVVYAGNAGGVDLFLWPIGSEDYSGLFGFVDRILDGGSESGLGFLVWNSNHQDFSGGELLGARRPTGSVGGSLIGQMNVDSSGRTQPRAPGSFLAWPATPEGTSVVVLARDGEALVWQRPVAGAVVFPLGEDIPTTGFEMIAYDVAGSVIETVGG
jgi:hypothetical protein